MSHGVALMFRDTFCPKNVYFQNSMTTRAVAKGHSIRGTDWRLLFSAGLLLLIGLLALYSASSAQEGHRDFQRQILWVILSIPVFFVFLFIDPRTWCAYSRILHVVNISLLVLVLAIGKRAEGAQRWLDIGAFQIQPSEIAKLLLVFTLAEFIARKKQSFKTWKEMAKSLLLVLPLFVLVYLQPDLGTSLVFLCIWIGMSLVAGQRLLFVGIIVCLGLVLFSIAWATGVIEDYQKKRISALLTGESSYHGKMATLSIASGEVVGQGFGKGAIKQARFVPEQTTDFIFTVIAEEGGFIGSVLTVSAFAYFLWRVWGVVVSASIPLFRYLAGGIFTIYSFHILVNLLMVVQVFPIVGVPLPFMSYGGSAMMLNIAMLGLLLNIKSREKHLIF